MVVLADGYNTIGNQIRFALPHIFSTILSSKPEEVATLNRTTTTPSTRNIPGQVLQSIQWAVFLLTNVIVVPVVVGGAFHMSASEVSTFMQHMLLITGLATLVQVFIGHRLPVAEGAAGMWWALFILLGTMAAPADRATLLQQLEMGLLIAGCVIAVIGLLPAIVHIRRLFTPIVTGVYLILLVSQMSGSFFRTMLGITATGNLNARFTILSLVVVLVMLIISLTARGSWRSLGPLIAIAVGWIGAQWWKAGGSRAAAVHTVSAGGSGVSGQAASWFIIPHVFTWGLPRFNFGVTLTAVLTALILISNVIASVLVVGIALERQITVTEYRRGIFGNGINLILSGLFSVVGVVPLSVSAGFISTTGIRAKTPFIIGAGIIAVSGFFPGVGHLFATLPEEVAYASLFIPFSQMMGFGIRDLMGQHPSNRNLLVIGLSLMVGIGMMFVPAQALQALQPWLRNILANGLLMGLIVCLLLEHVVFRQPGGENQSAT